MGFSNSAALSQSLANWLLRRSDFRHWLIGKIKQKYFDELELSIPLSATLRCPIAFPEATHCFLEIFVNGEYRAALEKMPLPERWLDIGCYAGFFSLYAIWRRQSQNLPADFRALLVDADSRMEAAVNTLMRANNISANQLSFRQGAIVATPGTYQFLERNDMSSTLESVYSANPDAGITRQVNAIAANEIAAVLPPPYDLVKVDIEGSEYDFLLAYQTLVEKAKYLLMEWHSWHTGGGGREQIKQMVELLGFELIYDRPGPLANANQSWRAGLFLFKRKNPL